LTLGAGLAVLLALGLGSSQRELRDPDLGSRMEDEEAAAPAPAGAEALTRGRA